MTGKPVLTSRHQVAISELLTGATQTDVATTVGVKPRTVRRWLVNPMFAAALRDAQDQALGQAARRMSAGVEDALDVLAAVMNDEKMLPTVRVRAALGWLEHAWRAKELGELTERIAAIEEVINHANQRAG